MDEPTERRVGPAMRKSIRAFAHLAIALLLICGALPATFAAAQGKADIAALHKAATANDAAAVKRLLAKGVAVDARDGARRTALLLATHANAVNAARALIEAGADVNAKDAIDDSPYLYAGAEGRLEILKLTLAAGADLTSTNRYGGTALTPAAHHGHVEVVKLLVKTRVPIDHVNNLGWTALMEAVVLGDGSKTYQQIVRLLVSAGADVSIPDKQGVTALVHAEQRGFSEIAAILKQSRKR